MAVLVLKTLLKDTFCKILTPSDSVLTLKILLKDTFLVLLILFLGLKDTVQEVLKDTFCKKLIPSSSVPGIPHRKYTRTFWSIVKEYQSINNNLMRFGRK